MKIILLNLVLLLSIEGFARSRKPTVVEPKEYKSWSAMEKQNFHWGKVLKTEYRGDAMPKKSSVPIRVNGVWLTPLHPWETELKPPGVQLIRTSARLIIWYAVVPSGSLWFLAYFVSFFSSSLVSIATTRLIRACLPGPVPVPRGRPAPLRLPPRVRFFCLFVVLAATTSPLPGSTLDSP